MTKRGRLPSRVLHNSASVPFTHAPGVPKGDEPLADAPARSPDRSGLA